MYRYTTCCVEMAGQDVAAMVEAATPVSYRTMRRRCADLHAWARAHGYDRWLPLSRDQHVGFFRSELHGQRVYYVRWSGIEFVFTRHGGAESFGYGSKGAT
jgi:hypothetical protein